jgi:hypothetical protein
VPPANVAATDTTDITDTKLRLTGASHGRTA